MYGMHAYLSKYDKGIYPEFTSVHHPLCEPPGEPVQAPVCDLLPHAGTVPRARMTA